MHLKPTFQLIFAALLVAAVLPSIPKFLRPPPRAAYRSSLARDSPISVSIGDPAKEWKEYRLGPTGSPPVAHGSEGLGIEAEGRDIDFGRPAGIPRMRQDTGLGGLIYTWNRYRNFRPYIKYLAGVGSLDFPPSGTYSHDTFWSFHPAEESNIARGSISGYAATMSTSSGTTYSDLMTSPLTALPLAHLTTSDLGRLRKDRPSCLSVI